MNHLTILFLVVMSLGLIVVVIGSREDPETIIGYAIGFFFVIAVTSILIWAFEPAWGIDMYWLNFKIWFCLGFGGMVFFFGVLTFLAGLIALPMKLLFFLKRKQQVHKTLMSADSLLKQGYYKWQPLDPKYAVIPLATRMSGPTDLSSSCMCSIKEEMAVVMPTLSMWMCREMHPWQWARVSSAGYLIDHGYSDTKEQAKVAGVLATLRTPL